MVHRLDPDPLEEAKPSRRLAAPKEHPVRNDPELPLIDIQRVVISRLSTSLQGEDPGIDALIWVDAFRNRKRRIPGFLRRDALEAV
jgi:hypothetical protein